MPNTLWITTQTSAGKLFLTSGQFTSTLKSSLAAELSAVFASSAIRNNDKVGLIMFTDGIEKFIPPRKGLSHVLRVIREVLYFEPNGKGTNIEGALDYLNKVTPRKSVTFLISDFLDSGGVGEEGISKIKKSLSIANRKHDVIAIMLNDPREEELPACGLVSFEDAETGETRVIDTTNRTLREEYQREQYARKEKRSSLFRSVGIDAINVSTDIPYTHALIRFFKQRQKRM